MANDAISSCIGLLFGDAYRHLKQELKYVLNSSKYIDDLKNQKKPIDNLLSDLGKLVLNAKNRGEQIMARPASLIQDLEDKETEASELCGKAWSANCCWNFFGDCNCIRRRRLAKQADILNKQIIELITSGNIYNSQLSTPLTVEPDVVSGSNRPSQHQAQPATNANVESSSNVQTPPQPRSDMSIGEEGETSDQRNTLSPNIIQNHDFSEGENSWDRFNYSRLSVIRGAAVCYAFVDNRTMTQAGLQQDITSKVSPGSTYSLSASVRVSGPPDGCSDVLATLEMDIVGSGIAYLPISRIALSKDRWETIKGTFTMPNGFTRVTLYLEGPSPGVNLLVNWVVVRLSPTNSISQSMSGRCVAATYENVIVNPHFEDGLNNWSGRGCGITLDSPLNLTIPPKSGKVFAATYNRTETWNGFQQEITGRVQENLVYEVTAVVRIHGSSSATIIATLWFQNPDQRNNVHIARLVQLTRMFQF